MLISQLLADTGFWLPHLDTQSQYIKSIWGWHDTFGRHWINSLKISKYRVIISNAKLTLTLSWHWTLITWHQNLYWTKYQHIITLVACWDTSSKEAKPSLFKALQKLQAVIQQQTSAYKINLSTFHPHEESRYLRLTITCCETYSCKKQKWMLHKALDHVVVNPNSFNL